MSTAPDTASLVLRIRELDAQRVQARSLFEQMDLRRRAEQLRQELERHVRAAAAKSRR